MKSPQQGPLLLFHRLMDLVMRSRKDNKVEVHRGSLEILVKIEINQGVALEVDRPTGIRR